MKITSIILIVLGFYLSESNSTERAEQGTLNEPQKQAISELGRSIRVLNDLIIAQDALTPLDATFLAKPETVDPLDLYKQVLAGFYGLHTSGINEVGEVNIPELGPLAETFLNMVEKRCVCARVTNRSECEIPYQKVQEGINHWKETRIWSGEFVVESNKFSNTKPTIVIDESEEWRKSKCTHYFPYLKRGIDHAKEKGHLNYVWFMHFIYYVTDLASTLIYQSFKYINTGYPAHFYDIGIHNFPKNQEFPDFNDLENPHLNRTENIAERTSTLPQMLKHAPGAMLFPYPFALEVGDFLNTTVLRRQLLLPCGFIFRPILADGWWHCPKMFFAHDIHHAAILAQDGSVCPIPVDPKISTRYHFNSYFLAKEWLLRVKSRDAYIRTLIIMHGEIGLLKEIASTYDPQTSEREEIEDRIKTYSLLAFIWAHEHRLGLISRIQILCDELAGPMGTLTGLFHYADSFFTTKEYLSILPKKYESLSEEERKQEIIKSWIQLFDNLRQDDSLCAYFNNILPLYKTTVRYLFIPYAPVPSSLVLPPVKLPLFSLEIYKRDLLSDDSSIKKLLEAPFVFFLFFRNSLNLPGYSSGGIPYIVSGTTGSDTTNELSISAMYEIPAREEFDRLIFESYRRFESGEAIV